MKNFRSLLLLVVLIAGWSFSLVAQTATATYGSGLISTMLNTNVSSTTNSPCSADLVVSVPAGQYVTGVDIEYDMTATAGAWMSEQRSFVECVTTLSREGVVYFGTPQNTGGTVSYSRSGLSFANGIVPASGSLTFRMHAFRVWGGTGCATGNQFIPNNTYKVTVHYGPPPTCPEPTAAQITAVTATSVDLSWISGGASNWQIEYWPVSNPTNKTLVNVSTNPFTLTGLSPSTSYQIQVRDSCGLGDVSFWTGFQVVKTNCATIPAPWTETFDSPDWVAQTFTSAGSVDTCFTRNWNNNMTWETGPPQFISTFTGPAADHTSGSGKFIYSDINAFGAFPDTSIIVTPEIDLTPLTTPEFSFWYHMFGTDIGTLKVQVSNNGGSSYTDVATIVGQQQNAGTDPWKERIINMSAYANSTVTIRFLAIQPVIGFQSDIAIDDLDMHEQPSCPKPQDLQMLARSFDRVTLGWTTGGATNWQIEYGSPGFTPGTGTLVSATTNPFTITGLSAQTAYEFYVRDSCGINDVSAWSEGVTVVTLCSVNAAPYLKTFDGPQFNRGLFTTDPGTIDTCWNRDVTSSFFVKTGPAFSTFASGAAADHTTGTATGKYLFSERILFTGNNDTAFVNSPLVDLGPLSNPQLSFWYHMFGADISRLRVLISNNFGLSFTQVYTRVGQQQNGDGDPWKEAIVDLSGYANDTIMVRFEMLDQNTGFSSNICIDDFNIDEQPTCPKPQDLSIVGYTNSTMTLSWTSGGSANWQIEYGTAGFTQGNGTLIDVTANPFTVTGLSPNTAYQFYVRDSCGVGDVSLWDGPVSDTTDCNPVSAPVVYTFDGPAWVQGSFFDMGSINSCWDRDYGLSYAWKPAISNTTFNTGPSVDHTSGTGKFMNADRHFGSGLVANTGTELFSPLIDLTPLTIPELSFWYHMFGTEIDSLVVDVYDGSVWNTEFVLQGPQQNSKTDAWKEAVVNLSAYAGDTIKIRFRATRPTTTSFAVATSIDDVDIHEQPTCPQPSNLAVVSAGANDITLSWTTGGATNWQIEYGPSGFTQGNGTLIAVNTNPFTVTGLTSATTYDFYLRDSCSATDVSAWIGPRTAATACLPVPAPFVENFDGNTWQSGPNFNDTGSIASCWVRYPLIDYFWRSGPAPFSSTFSGPSGDHTTGSGKYLYAESAFGGGSPPFDAFVETPPIDLSPLTVPELSFWYHMYGSGIGSLEVQIDNGSGFTTLQTWNGQQQISGTDAWQEAIISLSAYAGDTVVLRFKASKSSFSTLADAAIDDIDIHEAPNCPKPFNLAALPTSNGFVLSWTTGGATNWQVEYGPVGFSPGNGTIVNVATNPFNLTGLNPNTGYDIYLRDSCGVNDVSAWEGPVTDTTLCSVFSTPHTENFDGNSWVVGTFITDPGILDPCWDRDATTGYYWKVRTGGTGSANTGPNSDHTTGNGKYIFSENFGGTVDSTVFLSPSFDLSSLTNPEMRFWYHMYGADIDRLDVYILSGTTWSSLTTVTGQQQTNSGAAWQEQIASLSAYQNDTVRFRFVAHRINSGFLSDIALDDFWLGEAPNCPRPLNLTSTASTTGSVTLSWTTGGATNWLIGYRPSGTTAPLIILPAGTNPFTVTGLNASTSYDFYVKDSCAAGDVSLWTGPLAASTLCGVATAPWSEGFDGVDWVSGTGATNTGNLISSCWSRPTINNPNFGTKSGPTSSGLTGPNGDYNGSGKYIYTESSAASGAGQITSPFIFIPSNLINPRLRFGYHMYGAGIVSLQVQINNGSGFSTVVTLSGQQQTSNAAPWKMDSVSLNSYLGDTLRIRFIGTNNTFTGDIAVDEVSIVSDQTLCGDPSNITFTNITPTSARISWASPNSSSELEVVPIGQPQGSGDLYTGVSSPFDVNNLMAASTYVVYIRDSCNSGSYTNWITDTLTTLPCPMADADFSYGRNILKINFNSSASANADSVYWEFGDGSDTSFANPAHIYPGAGTYIVKLTAFNDCSSDQIIDTIVVCDTLLANFVNSQVGDTVILDAGSSQGGLTYYWELGDGTDTTGVIARHVYATAGSKLVRLTVVNACGDSATAQKTIKICLPPVAAWTAKVLGTTANGMQVQFDATASQNASSYEWDFGDGNTLSGQVQPLHTYVTPGLFYTVKLTVTNDCGDSSVKRYRLSEIGVEELPLSAQLSVYPNPATDVIYIEWDARMISDPQVSLYSVDGRMLMSTQGSAEDDGKLGLEVSGLPAGVYSLKVNSGTKVHTQQVIIH